MSHKSIFDNPTVPRLATVLEEVRSGNLLIPDFQRPFEWDDDRRLLLLDSVSRGMPIGSFLVWRTRKNKLKAHKNLGPFLLPNEPAEGEVRSYLLDGHQRLTTLYSALSELDDTRPLEEQGVRWPVYYDLSTKPSEQAFTLQKGRNKPLATWLPLSVLLAPKKLYEFQKKLLDQGLEQAAERAEALANSFKDYQIPIVPLVSEDLDVVTDSFVRVNNQGKPMQEAHMVRALSYSTFDIRERLDQLRQQLAPLGWGDLDDQILVNALKARFGLDVYKAGPRELHEKLTTTGYSETLQNLEENLKYAVRFLATCGVRGPRALPYSYQLVAITEAVRRLGASSLSESESAVRKWFWATTYASYFTGITSNRIRDAIEHLCWIVGGGKDPIPDDLPRQIQSVRQYNFTATRSKAFVLLMTERITEKAIRLKVQALLGSIGSAAVEKIFPTESGDDPANRIVITPEELGRVRHALTLPLPKRRKHERLLSRYGIPLGPEPLFSDYNAEIVLDQRRAELEQLEANFIHSIDLVPEFGK